MLSNYSLSDLPRDVLPLILSHLDFSDLSQVFLVNPYFSRLISSHTDLQTFIEKNKKLYWQKYWLFVPEDPFKQKCRAEFPEYYEFFKYIYSSPNYELGKLLPLLTNVNFCRQQNFRLTYGEVPHSKNQLEFKWTFNWEMKHEMVSFDREQKLRTLEIIHNLERGSARYILELLRNNKSQELLGLLLRPHVFSCVIRIAHFNNAGRNWLQHIYFDFMKNKKELETKLALVKDDQLQKQMNILKSELTLLIIFHQPIEKILQEQRKRNTRDSYLFHEALTFGHFRLVKYMIEEKKFMIDHVFSNKETPLQIVLKNGHFHLISYLLRKMPAEYIFNLEILKLLIDYNQILLLDHFMKKDLNVGNYRNLIIYVIEKKNFVGTLYFLKYALGDQIDAVNTVANLLYPWLPEIIKYNQSRLNFADIQNLLCLMWVDYTEKAEDFVPILFPRLKVNIETIRNEKNLENLLNYFSIIVAAPDYNVNMPLREKKIQYLDATMAQIIQLYRLNLLSRIDQMGSYIKANLFYANMNLGSLQSELTRLKHELSALDKLDQNVKSGLWGQNLDNESQLHLLSPSCQLSHIIRSFLATRNKFALDQIDNANNSLTVAPEQSPQPQYSCNPRV